MSNTDERLSIIETKFDGLSDTVTTHMEDEQEDRKEFLLALKEIRTLVMEVREDLTRYKAFIGGVLWAVSALGAALVFVWKYFFT